MAVSNVELRVDSRNAIRELNRVNKQTNVLAESVRKLGVRLAQFETVRRLFKGFREADSAASALETLGVNSRQLKKELLDVTAEINGLQSQTQLLAASYNVASAGFNDAASAAKILKAASFGATGGLSDLNTVADATTSVLNAYGLSSDKAAKLVDGFIQTQNDGKIVVAQYASQIGRVAPIAAAAGVGIEELNAAISTVTATGVPIESTFAGLRQVIAAIIKPTDEAKKVSKALGIEFNSAAIEAKGLGGFLKDVIEKTGGSEVALTKLFDSVEAVTAILPLTNDNLVSFNKNLDNQKKSAGAAEGAAKTLGGTVTNQITAIVNDMGTLARQLDEILGPVIKGLLTEVKKLTGEFVKFFALIQNAPSALEVFKGNLAAFFGAQSQGIDNLVSAVNMLDTSTVKTEEDAKQLEASISRIQYALGALKGYTTDKQLIDRGVADEISHIALRIDDLQDKLRQLRNAGLDAGKEETTKPTGKSPLQQQIEALLASLSDGGGGGRSGFGNQKVDISQKVLDLNLKLLAAQESEQKRLAATLALMVEKENILQSGLQPREEELRMAQAMSTFRQEIKGIDKEIADQRVKDIEKAAEGFEAQMAHQDELRQAIAEQKSAYEELNTTFRNGIVDSILDAVEGTRSLKDSLLGVIKSMARLILQQQLMNALGGFNLFGGGGGGAGGGFGVTPATSGLNFSGAFANGGRPAVGKAALVGERGPELFVPDRPGTIVPNHAMGSSNIVVNVDASGSNVQGDAQQGKALGQAIGAAVQAELIKQKRPGGLLS